MAGRSYEMLHDEGRMRVVEHDGTVHYMDQFEVMRLRRELEAYPVKPDPKPPTRWDKFSDITFGVFCVGVLGHLLYLIGAGVWWLVS